MARGQDLIRFSQALHALYACQNPTDLGDAVLTALQSVFDADSHVVNWIGPVGFEDISVRSAEFPAEASLEVFNAHIREHPLIWVIERWRTGLAPAAGRWSDFTTLREFQQKALYHDFFRLTETKRQIGATVQVNPAVMLGLSVNRKGKDFRAEDVELLRQLIGHAGQVFESLRGREQVEQLLSLQELVVARQAVMVVDEQGALLFATERARHLARDYFTLVRPDGLPVELHAWLQRTPPVHEVLVREQPGKRLACACGPVTPWRRSRMGEKLNSESHAESVRCVHFSETGEQEAAAAWQRLGLTPREGEVLRWITEGKRNSEIAIILGISERTVDKHREHLFMKLGVETRTAAAAALRAAEEKGG